MLQRGELEQILKFVANHWSEMPRDPNNKAMQGVPSDFWMNSIGGKAGKGYWVTTLMYTEKENDAKMLKDVLMKWQAKGMEKTEAPDLIKIKKK